MLVYKNDVDWAIKLQLDNYKDTNGFPAKGYAG